MCGDLPAGHKKYTVCMRLGANADTGRVFIVGKIDNVKEVWLEEYAIRDPNGAAVTPSLWKLNMGGFGTHVETSSGAGTGYPLVIDNASLTHVVFTRPRVMSIDGKAAVTSFEYSLTDADTGAAATFLDATFYVSFIYEIEGWSEKKAMKVHFDNNFSQLNHGSRVPMERRDFFE